MKKIIFILLFILTFSGVSAQRVYKDKAGKIYLDLSEESGVAPGISTKIPQYAGTFNAQNDKYLVDVDYVRRVREEPYYLLEVDKTDQGPALWAAAFKACKNKGTGWRLPTRTELLVIYIFREGIEALTNTTIRSGDLWSISEETAVIPGTGEEVFNATFRSSTYYYLFFVSQKKDKPYTYYRCVREVY